MVECTCAVRFHTETGEIRAQRSERREAVTDLKRLYLCDFLTVRSRYACFACGMT
jgi:hypothetical protein